MNAWKTFVQLISEDKKWIAKIISTNATTKKVTVQEVGTTGSVIIESNGTVYVADTFVYVQGTTITGQAPEISSAVKEIIS